MEAQVRRRYVNYKQKGSFSGLDNFSKTTKLKPKDIKPILKSIPAYRLHHPVLKTFPRRRVYASKINEQWAMDLADIQSVSRYNNKKTFLLCVIDVFSKKAWVEALANKSGIKVAQALDKIFTRSASKPLRIQSDLGKEFYNKHVKHLLKTKGIKLFSTTTIKKCSIAERFIRTFMGKIERYKTHTGSKKFVDKLRDFEWLYNNSFHRMIGMTPAQVTKENEDQVHDKLYGGEQSVKTKLILKVGDNVLLSVRKTKFDKGYRANFMKEVFQVSSCRKTIPPIYTLLDSDGQHIKGTFYKEELFKIG